MLVKCLHQKPIDQHNLEFSHPGASVHMSQMSRFFSVNVKADEVVDGTPR